jgi:hypothetical protein
VDKTGWLVSAHPGGWNIDRPAIPAVWIFETAAAIFLLHGAGDSVRSFRLKIQKTDLK